MPPARRPLTKALSLQLQYVRRGLKRWNGLYHIVFTLSQKEHLLRFGYVELGHFMSKFHMPGNKLNGFQLLPVEDADQPISAQHSSSAATKKIRPDCDGRAVARGWDTW